MTGISYNGKLFSDGPRVSIKLGEPLDLDNIEKGHDVYFTCKIDSNPSPKIIDWKYNVSILGTFDGKSGKISSLCFCLVFIATTSSHPQRDINYLKPTFYCFCALHIVKCFNLIFSLFQVNQKMHLVPRKQFNLASFNIILWILSTELNIIAKSYLLTFYRNFTHFVNEFEAILANFSL